MIWSKARTKKRSHNESGFTLMEMTIAIPLVALSGGFMVTILGNSLIAINKNAVVVQSAAAVEQQVKDLKNTKNCYELTQALATPQEMIEENSDRIYTITSELVEEKCSPGNNQVYIEVTRDSNGDRMYKTTTSVYFAE